MFLQGERHLFLALLVLVAAIGWSVWKRRRAAERERAFFASQQQAPMYRPQQRHDEYEGQQWRETQRQQQFQADYERTKNTRDSNPSPPPAQPPQLGNEDTHSGRVPE